MLPKAAVFRIDRGAAHSCVQVGEVPISNVVAPAVTGIILALVSLFGLVSSQTAAPDKNPASSEIIVYGDK